MTWLLWHKEIDCHERTYDDSPWLTWPHLEPTNNAAARQACGGFCLSVVLRSGCFRLPNVATCCSETDWESTACPKSKAKGKLRELASEGPETIVTCVARTGFVKMKVIFDKLPCADQRLNHFQRSSRDQSRPYLTLFVPQCLSFPWAWWWRTLS